MSSRTGSIVEPYVRATDGKATSSTTIHFPVDLHKMARVEAAKRGVKLSEIVTVALQEWFKNNGGE